MTKVSKTVRFGATAFAACAVALLAWAFFLEPRSLTLREYRLELPRWPQACSGTRVAVVADLHAGSPYHGLDKIDRIVERVADAHPSVVLLAGDFVIQGVENGRHLFVSTGLGTSIIPVRFRVPPEVSLLDLQPAP